jgi:lipopolysaccharide transport system permease protein
MRPLKDAGVILRLIRYEMSTQHRETLFGLATTAVWPLLQTVALLLAFGGFRSGGLAVWITSYLGVLVWNAAAGVIASNLAIFRTNRDLITQIVFPFYHLSVVDVAVKYSFLLFQMAVALAALLFVSGNASHGAALPALLVFFLCYFGALVAFGWLASLAGTILPDLSLIVPALLTMLLVLSPIFQRGPQLDSTALHLINLCNPLSHWVGFFDAALDATALTPQLLLPPILYSGALLVVAGTAVRYAFRELAKIV